MKIAFLIPNLSKGGAEHAVIRISRYLSRFHDVSIILFNKTDNQYTTDTRIIDMNLSKHNSLFLKPLNIYFKVKALKKIKKNEIFDVVISFLPNAHLINLLTKKHSTVVLSIRNHPSLSLKGFVGTYYKIIIRTLYNKADYIIPVTEEIKKDLVDNFNIRSEKIKVIGNGFPINEIEMLSSEFLNVIEKKIFDNNTIVSVGRLAKQKGHEILLKAMKIVLINKPELKLVIIGTGPEERRLKTQAFILGISEKVLFFGNVNNPFKYIKNSKLFVLSSLYEGFPNVLCEAMACKTPILTTNCLSGPYEILIQNTSDILHISDKDVIYSSSGTLVPIYKTKKISSEDIVNILANEIAKSIERNNEPFIINAYNRVVQYNIENIGLIWNNYLIESVYRNGEK